MDKEHKGMAPSLCLVRDQGSAEDFYEVMINQYKISSDFSRQAESGGFRKGIPKRSSRGEGMEM